MMNQMIRVKQDKLEELKILNKIDNTPIENSIDVSIRNGV